MKAQNTRMIFGSMPWQRPPVPISESPIVYCVERLFWLFEQISLGRVLYCTRSEFAFLTKDLSQSELKSYTDQRARSVEAYVVLWSLVVIAAMVITSEVPIGSYLSILVYSCVGYRIFDLTQAAINLSIFDPARIAAMSANHFGSRKKKAPISRISSKIRIIVLGVWNFIEIWACFGVIYAVGFLQHSKDIFSAYYFSAITQLTIGYGDITPMHSFRLVTMLQGVASFVFILILLSRFVSVLDTPEEVNRQAKSDF